MDQDVALITALLIYVVLWWDADDGAQWLDDA